MYLLLEIKNKDPLFQARYKRSQCCKLVKENCLFIEKGVGTKNNNLFDLWLQLAEELFSLSQSSRLEEYKFLSVSIFKSLFYFLHKEGFFLEENDFQKAVKFIFFKDSCIGFFKLGLPFELMDEIISYMNVDSYDLDFCQEFFGVEFSLRKA